MSPFVSVVNQILAVLTIVGQVIIAASLIGLLLSKAARSKLISFWGGNAHLFSFIVAAIAMSGSLFYSEIARFTPCLLCWYQRIAMYPQAIMLGIGLLKKDKNIVNYTVWLSVVGAIIAAYNYLLQVGAAPAISCSASGFSVSCSQRFVMQFGYITIAMMALTAFSLLIFFAVMKKLSQGRN